MICFFTVHTAAITACAMHQHSYVAVKQRKGKRSHMKRVCDFVAQRHKSLTASGSAVEPVVQGLLLYAVCLGGTTLPTGKGVKKCQQVASTLLTGSQRSAHHCSCQQYSKTNPLGYHDNHGYCCSGNL
jgi:hypothetical protein